MKLLIDLNTIEFTIEKRLLQRLWTKSMLQNAMNCENEKKDDNGEDMKIQFVLVDARKGKKTKWQIKSRKPMIISILIF